jgi:hypothetical protein
VADSHSGCVSAFADDNVRERIVRLDRRTDRERSCCENLATIRPGKGPHGAELRCAGCGRHRGWLPRQATEFLNAIVNRFGNPAEPIELRDNSIGDHEMKKFDDKNRGCLFKNDRKDDDTSPDTRDRSTLAAPSIGSMVGSGKARPAKKNLCRCR